MTRKAQSKVCWRRRKAELVRQQQIRIDGNLWWLKRAFLKAGGSELDWPKHRNPESVYGPCNM